MVVERGNRATESLDRLDEVKWLDRAEHNRKAFPIWWRAATVHDENPHTGATRYAHIIVLLCQKRRREVMVYCEYNMLVFASGSRESLDAVSPPTEKRRHNGG